MSSISNQIYWPTTGFGFGWRRAGKEIRLAPTAII
jgi:hypothetical protein